MSENGSRLTCWSGDWCDETCPVSAEQPLSVILIASPLTCRTAFAESQLSDIPFIHLIARLIYFFFLGPSAVFYSFSYVLFPLPSHNVKLAKLKIEPGLCFVRSAKCSVIHKVLLGLRAECSPCWEAHSKLPLQRQVFRKDLLSPILVQDYAFLHFLITLKSKKK